MSPDLRGSENILVIEQMIEPNELPRALFWFHLFFYSTYYGFHSTANYMSEYRVNKKMLLFHYIITLHDLSTKQKFATLSLRDFAN